MITECAFSGWHHSTTGFAGEAFVNRQKILRRVRHAGSLLTAVSQDAKVTAALDFTSQNVLMFGAGTGLFARQNFVLATHKAADKIDITEGDVLQIFGAHNANVRDSSALFSLSHNGLLKRDIFNADFFVRNGGAGSDHAG